jgi:hypothetical protein
MDMTRLFSFLLLVAVGLVTSPVTRASDTGCVTKEEMALYEELMTYRASKNLPRIPLSPSLSKVARLHSDEVLRSGLSNPTHDWKSCQLGGNPSCMWLKPKELAGFNGYGYEISWGSPGDTWTTADVLETWKKSSAHNSVIVEQGTWADFRWGSVGVSFVSSSNGSNANVWFAKESDPAGKARLCVQGPAASAAPAAPAAPENRKGKLVNVASG